ncbi:Kef-type K+ transport system [Striga asiatica]|uniref:Kef-type K+ transport system n=1 Tax=Striga asiatica TaxID=4170 RepID=A0A5A7QYW6_STRAF|nr:Kef-type K+ transport system [Striga asiatica]
MSNVMWRLISSNEAKAKSPWARPTISEPRLGPVLTGSSITATSPKRVGEAKVVLARATAILVGLGPVNMSWTYTCKRVTFSLPWKARRDHFLAGILWAWPKRAIERRIYIHIFMSFYEALIPIRDTGTVQKTRKHDP